MRLQVRSLTLRGTSRDVLFPFGMSALSGGMSGGKSAAVSAIRYLLGANPTVVPELEGHTVTGQLWFGDDGFAVSRRLVTTRNAIVDVAALDGSGAWRMPAVDEVPGYDDTYRNWLLERLHLPRVRVPQAPTKDASPLVPVTINDYMMYCVLRQSELDNSVFGTAVGTDKDIKRRYVFEIIYGLLPPEAAELREELRAIANDIRLLDGDEEALRRVLAATPWRSQLDLEVRLTEAERALQAATASAAHLSLASQNEPLAQKLRGALERLDRRISDLRQELVREETSLANRTALRNQLVAQSRRLSRAIVAESTLSGYEFETCPRCGSDVPERGDSVTCRLCLQPHHVDPGGDELAKEQERVIEQVNETDKLIADGQIAIARMRDGLAGLARQRQEASAELDRAVSSFVSDRADRIAELSAERARVVGDVEKYREYLGLWTHFDSKQLELAKLTARREQISEDLENLRSKDPNVFRRLNMLDESFERFLRLLDVPRFDTADGGHLDRKNYLPVVDGRPFSRLSSQGVEVLVNIAHALAHQEVCIIEKLALPNILVIDGLGGNVGREGLDGDRLRRVYQVLNDFAARERVQVIVTDNDPPPVADVPIVLELSDSDRFVP